MKYLHQYVTTNLNVGGGIDDSQTTGIIFQSLNNIDATKPSIACLSWSDPLDTSIAEWISYESINSTTHEAQGVIRGAEGYSAKAHLNQAVIAFPLSKSHINELNSILTSTTGAITATKDDDTMADNSDTALATQQSIKAYVDTYGNNSSLFRQAIINGNFDIWQRGTSFTPIADATITWGADHWRDYHADDGGTLPTLTRSMGTLTPGDIPNSYYYSRLTTNGAGTSLGANSLGVYSHKVEHGTRFLAENGKKITLSFYARSDIANKRIGVYLFQNYGSGGTPTSEELITGTNWTLTSSWTKYTYTFTLNTLAGKTFGTNNDDSLTINIASVWGSSLQSRTGASTAETYVGSGNIDIAQVQLCEGNVAIPFQPKSYEEELRACQRYCFVASGSTSIWATGVTGNTNPPTTINLFVSTPVTLRSTPAITLSSSVDMRGADSVVVTGTTITNPGVNQSGIYFTVNIASGASSGDNNNAFHMVNSNSAVLIANAEL